MYKRILTIATLAVLGLIVGAATAQVPTPATPPAISDAVKAQFFKAQSQMIQAKAQAQQAEQAFQQVVTTLNGACGESFAPQMNPQGDPVCAPKPAAAKTEKK
jgi:hypothetical protein